MHVLMGVVFHLFSYIALQPGEKAVAVLEFSDKEMPGIVLTDRRLIFAVKIDDAIDTSKKTNLGNRNVARFLSGVQSRMHNGVTLDNVKDIKLVGRKVVLRVKIGRFIPTSTATNKLDPDVSIEEVRQFIEEVKKQIQEYKKR